MNLPSLRFNANASDAGTLPTTNKVVENLTVKSDPPPLDLNQKVVVGDKQIPLSEVLTNYQSAQAAAAELAEKKAILEATQRLHSKGSSDVEQARKDLVVVLKASGHTDEEAQAQALEVYPTKTEKGQKGGDPEEDERIKDLSDGQEQSKAVLRQLVSERMDQAVDSSLQTEFSDWLKHVEASQGKEAATKAREGLGKILPKRLSEELRSRVASEMAKDKNVAFQLQWVRDSMKNVVNRELEVLKTFVGSPANLGPNRPGASGEDFLDRIRNAEPKKAPKFEPGKTASLQYREDVDSFLTDILARRADRVTSGTI